MNAPLISCIVPVYNCARFVADAVASIRAQSWPATEIIVVDDGSTDATASVVAGLEGVRLLRQANQGPSAARNAGVAAATGAFIAFLDADDLWHADKLERQMARFQARPELEICFAYFRNVQGADSIEGDSMLNPAAWPVSPFSPCSFVGRRGVFERVGPFNTELRRGEDTEWFMRAMLKGVKYELMPDVLVDRRIHENNLSREKMPTQEAVLDALKLVLDRRRAEGW